MKEDRRLTPKLLTFLQVKPLRLRQGTYALNVGYTILHRCSSLTYLSIKFGRWTLCLSLPGATLPLVASQTIQLYNLVFLREREPFPLQLSWRKFRRTAVVIWSMTSGVSSEEGPIKLDDAGENQSANGYLVIRVSSTALQHKTLITHLICYCS